MENSLYVNRYARGCLLLRSRYDGILDHNLNIMCVTGGRMVEDGSVSVQVKWTGIVLQGRQTSLLTEQSIVTSITVNTFKQISTFRSRKKVV